MFKYCIGLDTKKFKELVEEVLKETKSSYRKLERELGITPATFTRIKQEKNISIDSFIIICDWIIKNKMGFYWDDLTILRKY